MNPNNEFVHESLKKIIVEEDPNAFNSAAAPRETQNAVQTVSSKDEERQRKWYDSGIKAKKRGYGDFSPFYENATADYFFKCGYDNVPFIEAQQVLKEKIEQILDAKPEVKEVLNELQPQKS